METAKAAAVLAVLLVTFACQSSSAYKFLVLHPFYAGSHVLTLQSVTENLIARGHSVTTVRFADPYGLTMRPMGPNHTEVLLHLDNSNGNIPFVSKSREGVFQMPLEILWDRGKNLFTVFKLGANPWLIAEAYCHQLLGNSDLVEKLKASDFDVAVVDLIYNECGLAMVRDLGLPSVGYWAFSFSSGEAEMTPVATPASHIPTFMSRLTHDMTFRERLYNFALKIFSRAFMWGHCWFCDSVIRQYYPDMPSSMDLLADLNGALLNTNNVIDYPRLQPETYINVGGIQISRKPRPLPKDIQEFIDGADHGVVLLTMGFIFNPKAVPKERVDALLTAFSRLPQRVIVKFESIPDNVPDNVMVKKFLPQQDILAHPKTRVFVTHCGMHGVIEAIWNGVPMVGMPVFIDQPDVLVRMEERGIAVGIEKWATAEEIYDAIVAVRDDPKYKRNVDRLSALLHKQRYHPMDDAIWLLEYVAKTKGADHLRLSSRHMNLIQYFSLDVMAFLLVATFLILKTLRFVLSVVWGKIWRKGAKIGNNDNNNVKKHKHD